MRYLLGIILICFSCSTVDDSSQTEPTDDHLDTEVEMDDSLYFPPLTGAAWETIAITEAGWNEEAFVILDNYLQETGTKAFIILKNGHIVIEKYYQNTNAATNHPWNSAAKTLTAATIGIAQEEGLLAINDVTSTYLGQSWTAMNPQQEDLITIKNQLTMTTGGDYGVNNLNCTDPECLTYLHPVNTEWYYHNAFYTLLQDVVTNAVNEPFEDYFYSKIQIQIGMDGFWFPLGYTNRYLSTARGMARFGLLSLNNGNWDGNEIIDPVFFTEMTTPSQSLNKAYGYLWWINGQQSYRLPGTTTTFSGKLIPSAPEDLIAGLGKDDQKLYIVPSEGLVIIRLGDASGDDTLGPSGYDETLWQKIMDVID